MRSAFLSLRRTTSTVGLDFDTSAKRKLFAVRQVMSATRPNLAVLVRVDLVEKAILDFLRDHPDSTLLSIVVSLRPDFSDLSETERAAVWFGYKRVLHELFIAGTLDSEEGLDGVRVWWLGSSSASGNRTP